MKSISNKQCTVTVLYSKWEIKNTRDFIRLQHITHYLGILSPDHFFETHQFSKHNGELHFLFISFGKLNVY